MTTRVLAPNPGPMTLEGTSTYIVRAPGSTTTVIIDPGPDVGEHLDAIASHGLIELILLTHHHLDHAESAATLSAATDAPVRAKELQRHDAAHTRSRPRLRARRPDDVGICGQGPSDHPDLAEWLVAQGIESMSLIPDTVVETWLRLAKQQTAQLAAV